MKILKQILAVFTISTLITLIIYWKIPIKGLVPFPGDLLVGRFFPFNTQSWEGFPLGVPYKEFINADVVRQIYPWRDLSITLLKQGEIPYWNPYAFSGTPLLANIQSAPFYPLNILYWAMDHQIAWIVQVLLQPILAITFMWLFLKELKLSKAASLLGAVSFAFSGYMVIWWELNTVGHAALWLPFILWGIEKWLKEKNNKFLAVIIFGQVSSLLAGHLQTNFYVFIVVATYFLFRIKTFKKNKKAFLLPFFTSMFISGILVAPQLLPALKLLPFTPRGIQQNKEIFSHFILPIKHLVTFISHDYFGNPATKNFWGKDYGEFMGYFGVTALFFAITSIIYVKNKETKFFSSLAAVALLFALPTPFPYLLQKLKVPILSTSAPSRTLFIVQFCGAVLAGLGLDYLLKSKKAKIIKSVTILFLMFTIVWTITGVNFLQNDVLQKANWRVSLRNLVIPTGIFLAVSATFIFRNLIEKKFKVKLITPILLVLLFLPVFFEYSYFANKFQTFSEFRFIFPKSPIYSYLEKESQKYPFRIFGDYTASVTSNSWIPYKVYGVEGYDSLYLQRYGELLAASQDGIIPESIPRSDANLIKNSDDIRRRRLQDLLGVRFILDKNDNPQSDWEPDPHRFPPDRYQLLWQKGKFKVYENTQSLPRAFLVGNYIVETNQQKIINELFNPDFDLLKTVILEEKITQEVKSSEGKVELISYEPNTIKLQVESSTPQLLFLSDSYYPDWQATINGNQTQIYRANYAFRAVHIPPGDHTVVFKYVPKFL